MDANTDPVINSLHTVDFDPDAKRAQIDTGAFATVTGDKQLVHDYKEFSESFPCPIKLLPATENSDTIPAGMGYMHVMAPNADGYIPVRTFFHPSLRTTVINEQDFLRAQDRKVSDFRSEHLEKYHEAGTWTFTGSSYHSKPRNVIIHGILLAGKCYTHPLIPCYDNSQIDASIATLKLQDADFADECDRAAAYSVFLHQEADYEKLRDNLAVVPKSLHDIPFHEYIHRNTPVNSLRTQTSRMLWHQRLGHQSDHYLYNAHKYVEGVPEFRHESAVMDTCPTCIKAKQVKSPPTGNTTLVATQPYQGLSIDFLSPVPSPKMINAVKTLLASMEPRLR